MSELLAEYIALNKVMWELLLLAEIKVLNKVMSELLAELKAWTNLGQNLYIRMEVLEQRLLKIAAEFEDVKTSPGQNVLRI